MLKRKYFIMKSFISFEILRKVLKYEDIEDRLGVVYVNNEPLEIDGKIMLLWNNKTIRKRRNDKEKYDFLDFYDNKKQFDYIFDIFLLNTEINQVVINKINSNNIEYSLVNNENLKLHTKIVDFYSNLHIIDLICKYFNIF